MSKQRVNLNQNQQSEGADIPFESITLSEDDVAVVFDALHAALEVLQTWNSAKKKGVGVTVLALITPMARLDIGLREVAEMIERNHPQAWAWGMAQAEMDEAENELARKEKSDG